MKIPASNGWTVFVGGVEVVDYLVTHSTAEEIAEQYHAEDYDDVEIAFVNVWVDAQ